MAYTVLVVTYHLLQEERFLIVRVEDVEGRPVLPLQEQHVSSLSAEKLGFWEQQGKQVYF